MTLFDNRLVSYLAIVFFDVVLLLLFEESINIPLPKNPWFYYSGIFLLTTFLLLILNYGFIKSSNEEIAFLSIFMGFVGSLLLNKSKAKLRIVKGGKK